MAVVGLGTDIVEIARIEKQLEKSDRLAQRVLTQAEYTLFQQHKFPARYLAKRFAAKEAVVKAIGIGIGNGISFQDVEVLNHPSGQPFLTLSGKVLEVSQQMGVTSTHISISDELHYAMATVVLDK